MCMLNRFLIKQNCVIDRFERKGSVKSPPSFPFTLNWDINYLRMCETPTLIQCIRLVVNIPLNISI